MERHLRSAALIALVAAFFGFFAVKEWDIDFWWHIASGKNIVATHSLPDHDPFSVYESTDARSITILKCYWVGQIIFYLIVKTFGINGIILFRAFLLAFCLLIVYRRSSSLGVDSFPAFLMTALAGMTAFGFTGDRPQLFSFLFVSVVFLLLDRHNVRGGRRFLFMVPVAMFVWANVHGGVVMGSFLLVVYSAGYLVEHAMKKTPDGGKEQMLFSAVMGISIVVTLFSQSGINTYLTVVQLEGTEFQKRLSEYMSPYAVWRQLGSTVPLYYFGALLLAVPACWSLVKRKEIAMTAVILSLAAVSATAYRYIPFFLFVAGPYIASGLNSSLQNLRIPKKAFYGLIASAAVIALTWGIHEGRAFQRGIDETRFPVGAVRWLQQQGVQGKMFTSFEWGGYLLWNVYPQVRVFIDGRGIDADKFTQYTHILWMTDEGKVFFDAAHFDFVMIPRENKITHEPYPLNQYLLVNPQWRVLYEDAQGYLFGRK